SGRSPPKEEAAPSTVDEDRNHASLTRRARAIASAFRLLAADLPRPVTDSGGAVETNSAWDWIIFSPIK
ncbi:MAG: hypothetical protein ACUVXJ_18645, partial [Phycisphaerae bacterium]